MSQLTTVLCAETFHNPHIASIYDQLAVQDGVSVTRVCTQPLPNARAALGWSELPSDAPYLQPWRRRRDYLDYGRRLLTSDMVVLPALMTMPAANLIRVRSGKPLAAWSEPFMGHPRTLRRAPYAQALRRQAMRLFDTPRYNLLVNGHNAALDYQTMGLRHWQAWEFTYAVAPIEEEPVIRLRPSGGNLELLFVGSLTRRKGVDVLLRALGHSTLRNLPWRLSLVGDGPRRRELEQLAGALGVRERLLFHGTRAMDECKRFYNQVEVLVLPSRYDGWGAVLNEAMESGLALLASDQVGAAHQLIEPGRNGFLFRSEDSRELAGRLKQMIEEPSLVYDMRLHSRDRIRMFRPHAAAQRLAQLCRGLAGHASMPGFTEGLCRAMPLR